MTARARGARTERSRLTRDRVVTAAAPLFVRDGYLETTMAGIARAAGVAVQTLYLSFGGKAAVLEAAVAPDGQDQPNEWLAALRAEPSGPVALRGYVAHAAVQLELRAPLDAVLRSAAADPEPAELLRRARATALGVHGQAVDEFAEKPGFTTHISVQRATEVVATLLSPEIYGLLVLEQGWPAPDWTEWAATHLAADLYPA